MTTITTRALVTCLCLIGAGTALAQSQPEAAPGDRLEQRLAEQGFTDLGRETVAGRTFVTGTGAGGDIRIPLPTEAEMAERRAQFDGKRTDRQGRRGEARAAFQNWCGESAERQGFCDELRDFQAEMRRSRNG